MLLAKRRVPLLNRTGKRWTKCLTANRYAGAGPAPVQHRIQPCRTTRLAMNVPFDQ